MNCSLFLKFEAVVFAALLVSSAVEAATPASFPEYAITTNTSAGAGNAYFDLGFKAFDGISVELDIEIRELTKTDGTTFFFGNWYCPNNYVMATRSDDEKWGVMTQPQYKWMTDAPSIVGSRHRLRIHENGDYYMDGVKVGSNALMSYAEQTANLYLFSCGVDARGLVSHFYRLKVWKGPNLFALFYPCVDSDGQECLYEYVSKRLLYPKQGTFNGVGTNSEIMIQDGVVTCPTAYDDPDNLFFSNSWKQPVDGKWSDATKWSRGVVPDASDTVGISAAGDYTVTMDEVPAAMPAKIRIVSPGDSSQKLVIGAKVAAGTSILQIEGDGAKMSVGANGEWVMDQDGTTSAERLKITGGGELEVDGGAFLMTNYVGRAILGGNFDAFTSRVTVVSGVLDFCPKGGGGESYTLDIYTNGFIDVRGGVFNARTPQYGDNPIRFLGGVLKTSGSADYNTPKFGGEAPYLKYGTGAAVFSGDSTWTRAGENTVFVAPNAAGEVAHVAFLDRARCVNGGGTLTIGGTAGGTAVVEFSAAGEQGGTTYGLAYNVYLGCTAGVGEMLVGNGIVYGGCYGTRIGGSVKKTEASAETYGHLTVTGGVFRTSYNKWPARLPGITVGEGSSCALTDTSLRPYVGRIDLTGGAISNTMGVSVIGSGFGRGDVIQTGGLFEQCESGIKCVLAVGLAGGVGTWTMNGGATLSKQDVYIGGAPTNALEDADQLVNSNYPFDRHDAVGTLTVSGGTFTAAKALNVGFDGTGTVEMVGSRGGLSANTLVLSNTTGVAASTLRFVADKDGFSPIAVSGKATIAAGTKLVVDATAVEGEIGRQPLLTFDESEGSFADGDISVVSPQGGRVTYGVRKGVKGYWYSGTRGLMLYLR